MSFSIVLVEKGSRGGKWRSRLKCTLMHIDVKNLQLNTEGDHYLVCGTQFDPASFLCTR